MKTIILIPVIIFGFIIPGPETFKTTVIRHDYVRRVGGVTVPAENAPTDEVWEGASSVTIKEDTWTIPNCLETGFALEILIENIPSGVSQLEMEIRYPPMQLPDGKVTRGVKRPVDLYIEEGRAYLGYSYYFDYEFERSPGTWEITFRHEDKFIYTAKFEVVPCRE